MATGLALVVGCGDEVPDAEEAREVTRAYLEAQLDPGPEICELIARVRLLQQELATAPTGEVMACKELYGHAGSGEPLDRREREAALDALDEAEVQINETVAEVAIDSDPGYLIYLLAEDGEWKVFDE